MTVRDNIERNPNRKTSVIALISFLVIIVFGLTLWVFGKKGLFNVFVIMIVVLICLTLIGGVVLIVLKLFFPPKPDMIKIVGNRIQEGAEMRKPDNKVKVYLSGDKKDFERKFLGELGGITKTRLDPQKVLISKEDFEKLGEKDRIIVKGKYFKIKGKSKDLFFLTLKSGILGKGKIIGVLRDDMSNPNMDELYIKDTTLTLPFGNIFYPAKYDGQTYIIEEKVRDFVHKYALEDMLKDFKLIIDDAIMSNPGHQKGLENKGTIERIAGVGEDPR